jgi:hypothetical protein
MHELGAVALTIGVTQFNVRQYARDRVPGTEPKVTPELVH